MCRILFNISLDITHSHGISVAFLLLLKELSDTLGWILLEIFEVVEYFLQGLPQRLIKLGLYVPILPLETTYLMLVFSSQLFPVAGKLCDVLHWITINEVKKLEFGRIGQIMSGVKFFNE